MVPMISRALIRADGRVEVSGLDAPVPWWSFGKTVLAVALLRLSERGDLDLDRAVDGASFTPAQLLRHEAGLPDYGSLAAYQADVAAGRAPWPVEVLLEAVGAGRLGYAPGQGWGYSNVGYLLVSRLIEAVSGLGLADALRCLVFEPAGVASARLARSRGDLAMVRMGDVAGYDPGWVYHGLIVGTAVDAGRLLHVLLGGGLLEARTLRRMLEGRALPAFRSALEPDPAYGMGLMLRTTGALEHPIGHRGSGPGSEIAVYGRRGVTCVVWAAGSAGIDPVAEVFLGLERGGA